MNYKLYFKNSVLNELLEGSYEREEDRKKSKNGSLFFNYRFEYFDWLNVMRYLYN